VGVEVEPDDVADADADAEEEALAEVELLTVEVGLDDDGGDVLGAIVALGDLLVVGLAEVAGAVDGDSTVLGVGLAVTD